MVVDAAKCIDINELCPDWALEGECQKNPEYMLQYCKKSCNVCTDAICEIDEIKCVPDNYEEPQFEEDNEGESIEIEFYNDIEQPVEIFWVRTEDRDITFINDLSVSIDFFREGINYGPLKSGENRSFPSHLHVMWVLKNSDTGEHILNYLTKGIVEHMFVKTSGNDNDFDKELDHKMAEHYVGVVQPGNNLGQVTYIGSVWRFQIFNGDTIRKMKIRLSAGLILKKDIRRYSISGRHPTDINWDQIYPRDAVRHPMRLPGPPGTIKKIESDFPYWDNIKKTCDDDMDQKHTIQLTSLHEKNPRIWIIPNFISPSEATTVIQLCKSRMFRSTTGSTDRITTTSIRRSKTCFLKNEDVEMVRHIASRAYEVLNITYKKGRRSCEDLQVVEYDTNGEYQAHHDYFSVRGALQNAEVQSGSNRYATIMFVLSAPEKGGSTSFPNVRDDNGSHVAVNPVLGQAIFWYHVTPDGNLDINSLHAGDPVIKGKKWIATYFCWDYVR